MTVEKDNIFLILVTPLVICTKYNKRQMVRIAENANHINQNKIFI